MPIIRRALTVAAVTAVGTLAFALPAWAHEASITRDCTQVHLTLGVPPLRPFQASPDEPNVVTVTRDGKVIDTLTFNDTHASADYDQAPDVTVTYRASWKNTGPDGASGHEEKTFEPVKDCEEQPPETVPAPPTTSAPAPKAPATTTPAATPSPTPKVEAAKLANTGAGNTVPLLVVGTVLVAGGVALTFVTRRRRSGNTSS